MCMQNQSHSTAAVLLCVKEQGGQGQMLTTLLLEKTLLHSAPHQKETGYFCDDNVAATLAAGLFGQTTSPLLLQQSKPTIKKQRRKYTRKAIKYDSQTLPHYSETCCSGSDSGVCWHWVGWVYWGVFPPLHLFAPSLITKGANQYSPSLSQHTSPLR